MSWNLLHKKSCVGYKFQVMDFLITKLLTVLHLFWDHDISKFGNLWMIPVYIYEWFLFSIWIEKLIHDPSLFGHHPFIVPRCVVCFVGYYMWVCFSIYAGNRPPISCRTANYIANMTQSIKISLHFKLHEIRVLFNLQSKPQFHVILTYYNLFFQLSRRKPFKIIRFS